MIESLVSFFEDLPTTFRATVLIGGIFVFWVMEGVIPLFQFRYNIVRIAKDRMLKTSRRRI